MTNSLNNERAPGWFWQDYLSTYRFWGLVLASFLLSLSSMLSRVALYPFLQEQDLGGNLLRQIYAAWPFANYIAILVVLYFFRRRFKTALLMFSGLAAVSMLLLYSGLFNTPIIYMVLQLLISFGTIGFTITAIAVLVGGRPSISSFIITYSVILFWNALANIFGPAAGSLFYDAGFSWIVAIPALLAFIALLPVASKLFFEAPDKTVEAEAVTKREPFLVFLFSAFIPFYILYWLSKRPGELKTIAPDMRQPTGTGAVCMGLFAPFILPIWFHDVRADLGDKLPTRSAKALAVVTFFFPTIGAAMAQSDNNALMSSDGSVVDVWEE